VLGDCDAFVLMPTVCDGSRNYEGDVFHPATSNPHPNPAHCLRSGSCDAREVAQILRS
jgi:hypothetical protein